MSIDKTKLSSAFDSGNYANAYTSTDLREALARQTGRWVGPDAPEYISAFVLGFYSSYEPHEVPNKYRSEYEAALCSKAFAILEGR